MHCSREAQEYWSGEPIPSPADLPDPGIEQVSHVVGRFFTSLATREAQMAELSPEAAIPFCTRRQVGVPVALRPGQRLVLSALQWTWGGR